MKEPDPNVRVLPISHIERRETAAVEPAPAGPPAVVDPRPAPREEPSALTSDQRGASRYPFSGSAEAFEPRTRTRISGRLADLGVGGCYIDTVSPFPVGTDIRLRLTSEGRVLQAAAVVTYAVHGMGMGLAFTRMSPEYANLLSSWLAELSGEATPSLDWDPQEEPALASQASPSDSANSPKWLEAARELVELLKQKQILSDAEFTSLQKRLSG